MRIMLTAIATVLAVSAQTASTNEWKVVGWNDLGMHCMDGKDYSVYSILPPFNNIHAHVLDANGKLIKSGTSVQLTYEAVADPTGSINRTSVAKTNFWSFSQALYGAALAPDAGLAGYRMPGASNTPQNMKFDAKFNWFSGEGIPISPFDDNGIKNYYPMMRIKARSAGKVVAQTDIVLPVSDELDCSACHASGSTSTARPSAGWAFDPNPEKDYKYNVLRIHDEKQASNPLFQNALAKMGFSASGLHATARGGRPVLCAGCHGSNALPGTGLAGITPLTRAVHAGHARVPDPTNMLTLDAANNRTACYRCHPGSETKCLRGVMGNALATDGSMTMQCQSCHGNMSQVGAANRTGWLQEPSCQNCHTGNAIQNNGQIRYTSAFDNAGALRTATNATFSTNANVPAAGFNLYRFSKGHGGLQCEACHGATHAEYPSSHVNDNLQSISMQKHAGTLVECTACHSKTPSTVTGGPHGLHPIGQSWVGKHGDAAEKNAAQCRTCHGADYRGSVLSKAQADRSFSVEDRGTLRFPAGTQIGCYNCHNGPRGE